MIQRAQYLRGMQPSLMRQLYETAPPGSINLALGDTQVPLSQQVIDAGQAAFRDSNVRYTGNPGIPELREKIAGLYDGRLSFTVTADNVIVTPGGMQAIYQSLLAHLNPGEEVLIPVPGFPPYKNNVEIVRGVPAPYMTERNGGYVPTVDSIMKATTEKTRFLILNSPNNPTGAVYPRKTLEEIAGFARSRGIAILSDEVYSGILYDGKTHHSAGEFTDDVIIIGSASKMYGLSGLRLGWAVAGSSTIKNIVLMQQNIAACACSTSQQAALVALSSPPDIDYYRERRDLTMHELDAHGIPYFTPSGAIYLYVDVSRWGDSLGVAERLCEAGVILVPGTDFRDEAPNLRMCFAFGKDVMAEAVHRMSTVLK